MVTHRVKRDWDSIVKQYKASGQTVAEFCAGMGIAKGGLYFALKRKTAGPKKPTGQLVGFAPISEAKCEVTFNGFKIACPAASLKSVLQTLEDIKP